MKFFNYNYDQTDIFSFCVSYRRLHSRFHFVIIHPLQDDAVPATKRNPSNFADLDPKTMKLVELREELEARNLSARG